MGTEDFPPIPSARQKRKSPIREGSVAKGRSGGASVPRTGELLRLGGRLPGVLEPVQLGRLSGVSAPVPFKVSCIESPVVGGGR